MTPTSSIRPLKDPKQHKLVSTLDPCVSTSCIMYALYPDIVSSHCPAMPVIEQQCQHEHREKEPDEAPSLGPFIYDSVDTFACPAEMSDGEAPADDEDDSLQSRTHDAS